VVCGADNQRGLNLAFRRGDDGWVEATLDSDDSLQGYARLMHGGIIALLLDAAMTNCLFAYGCAGVTATMEVKFRQPVGVDAPVHVRARLIRSASSAHQLRAELLQADRVKATATALFVHRPAVLGPDECP
jgi:acyl-coenzyme A thioesterase PaaI-like protein